MLPFFRASSERRTIAYVRIASMNLCGHFHQHLRFIELSARYEPLPIRRITHRDGRDAIRLALGIGKLEPSTTIRFEINLHAQKLAKAHTVEMGPARHE